MQAKPKASIDVALDVFIPHRSREPQLS